MDAMFFMVLTVLGLCVFETVSSLDNAVINAEVLSTMGKKARKWFLTWGIFIAVFLVRGLLPWLIVWLATPGIGFLESFTATFSGDTHAAAAVKTAAPLLLCGGGVFLLLLFLHWLFVEEKHYGLPGEKFFQRHGIWFHLIASVAMLFIIWQAVHVEPMLALSASIGSTAFFLSHGLKEQAEKAEQELTHGKTKSDLSKILFLEVIDLCFSIDGVIGAFAFTMNVPLILLGNGLGAIVVRQLTVANVERIKNYPFMKNGAMYAVGVLGAVMLLEAFHFHVPVWFTPTATLGIVSYFFWKCMRQPMPAPVTTAQ